jgi:hypothetical protein
MTGSEGPRIRLAFWQAFKQFMAEDPVVMCGRASSETWMHQDVGLNFGRLFSMVRVRTSEIGSQWATDDASARTVYSFLSAHRPEIEAGLGQDVTWRVVNERMYELEVRLPADLSRREEWPSLFQWLSSNLHTFRSSIGEFVGKSTPSSHQGDWDEASFFEELAKNCGRGVEPARRLLAWSRQSMPLVYWGHGQSEGSFVPVLLRQGIEHSVVSVYTTGVFCVRFGALKKTPPFDEEQLRNELLARLNAAPHVDLPPTVVERYPGLPLPLLDEPNAMAVVLDAMDWVVSVVKSR